MSIRSKILLLCISTLVLISVIYTISWSCGPLLSSDQGRFSLFRPDLATGSNLEPFYYTERFLNSYTPDPAGIDYQRNCEEWRIFTENKAALNDIYTIQYNTDPDSFIAAYTGKKWDSYKNNSFVQWMLKKGNKETLQYMALAKKVEYGQNTISDPWNPVERPYRFDSIAQVALKEAEGKLPVFLKQRYAFQAVKLWYYAGDTVSKRNAIATYDKYLKNQNSIASTWGLVYYAMLQNSRTERTRYLLQAFDKSEEKKVFAYKQVSLQDLSTFEKMNTDTALVPVIYAMKAIKNPGKALAEIQDVYRYAPNSAYLPLLISREINKLEDWLLTPEVLGFSSWMKENEYYRQAAQSGEEHNTTYNEYAQKNWAKDKTYLRDVRRFLQTMLERNYANKNFLRLAIVHLYHMEGNYNEAKSYLVDVDALNEKAWQTQLEIERLISLIHLNEIREPETKAHIYAGIKRLEQQGLLPLQYQHLNEDDSGSAISDELRDDMSEVLLLLSREFKHKGDVLTAGMLYQKADIITNEYDGFSSDTAFRYNQIAYFDRYASPETIDSLLTFKHNTGKTEFEQYITPRKWAADEFYLDLKGTIQVREKKYYEALATFSAMPEQFWAHSYEFKDYLPAKSILNSGTLLPTESGPNTLYPYPSKKLLLEDIIRQQEALNATSSPAKKANIYFLLGNAYYNISFYGKAWMLFSYGNSESEVYSNTEDNRWHNWAFFSFYPNSVKYGNSYYRLSDAMDMYYRAYNHAGSNRELAAKSLLMLTYCDHLVNKDPYAEKKYYSKYLQIVRAIYGNTSTYRASKTYCPDISAFMNE